MINRTQHISVSINELYCKQCGLCIAFCPKKVFTMSPGKTPIVACPDLCSGCRRCVYWCPDFAIQLKEV